jgi:hypothetical protein
MATFYSAMGMYLLARHVVRKAQERQAAKAYKE